MKASDVLRKAAQQEYDNMIKETVDELRKISEKTGSNKTDKQLTRIAKSMLKDVEKSIVLSDKLQLQ